MNAADLVSVRILGREYRLRCAPDERDALLAAAARLDREMRRVQQQAQLVGNERILLLAALNIAHELVRLQGEHEALRQRLGHQIRGLNQLVTRLVEAADPS